MFIEYRLADGSVAIVEVTEEVAAFMAEDSRRRRNADRKERYHARYSLDALLFEGEDFADTETPETVYVGYEEERDNGTDDERMDKYLASLTEAQRRRLLMRLEHMTPAEIARSENVDESSVRESIESAGKKLHKKFPKIF